MEKEFNTELSRTAENQKKKGKKRAGTFLGWLVIILAVIVVVPVGIIMFLVSGLWSAADKTFGG